jgi:Ribbon-helix-helix domain
MEDHLMPREETTRTCMTLMSRQVEAMRSLSRETGAPVAELTRRAVDAFLATRVAGYISGTQHPEADRYDTGTTASSNHS